MPETQTLQDMFLDELRDAYDAEKQLIKALPKLAKASTSPQLREAFQSHLEETRGHVNRLEKAFQSIGEKPRGKHCDGIEGIIEEGKHVMEEDLDEKTMDACLIAAGQRAEHYEMAAYGTLAAWAKVLGHSEAATLLASILEEEKAADEKLSMIGEGGVNQDAANGMSMQEDEDTGSSRKRGSKRSRPRASGNGRSRTTAKKRSTKKTARRSRSR